MKHFGVSTSHREETIDVTCFLNEYSECIRHIWNCFFLSLSKSDGVDAWDVVDQYENICALLFRVMVAERVHLDLNKSKGYDANPGVLMGLRILSLSNTSIPIMLQRSKSESSYWDNTITVINTLDVDLRLIDFFDFDRLAFRNNQFYRVRVITTQTQPELVGLDGLVDTRHVLVKAMYPVEACSEVQKSN